MHRVFFNTAKDLTWLTHMATYNMIPSADFLQTKLYIEDWIGLKTLDKAGRVKYISVAGDHIKISNSDMRKYVTPYLQG